MRAFVNELALAEACAAAHPPHAPLEALIKARLRHPVLVKGLYCARGMPNTEIWPGVRLAQVGWRLPHDKRSLLFQWVSKNGPFIEDDRQAADDDLFLFDGEDVTDLGLGEAARRILAERPSAALSPIQNPASRFVADPLWVVHGLEEEPIGHVPVANFRETNALADALRAARPEPEPTTWSELLAEARGRFDRLHIGSYCDGVLARHPYHPPGGRRILDLLGVLQRLTAEMDDDGRLSTAGEELRNTYFVGKRSWFSDESETRKRSPETFTFPDPGGDGTLVCFWHGKVSTQAFRIHFEWPVSPPVRRLRIVYIGPHL